MQGMDRTTGKVISGTDWLEQQITDVLTTAKTTRVMRAWYGSNLHQYLDRNITADLAIEITAEVSQALSVLASVFRLSEVKIDQGTSNEHIVLTITGTDLQTGQKITLEGVEVA